MSETTDDSFYDRADEHIHLSNEQLKRFDDFGKVNASMMFGTTRFNAWVSARGFKSGEEMAQAREAMLNYFCNQYRMMLEDNLDDHINNFSQYMGAPDA
ncbi:DUF3144 domain-containing protein [Pseudomonas gingeri NCPPB 3146 = LMG 5327]|uniref:DUF3144 domain-containing protein n=2 Tax=Pseudomonas gingeri TaxID=117681 RepID=A0A7Y8CGD5_9PSED|nr:DUF3144 domain-containing protein [Pseudomonas gingeri]NVZ27986.1 DUF3144 domain-containing protein [Pseudomonas gingeri]NWC17788.1 DUF3144 domain-containing protein [Pseudomonas gingeri]NWE48366.1 DUF3144 domain-containing protein [Pseudomonas gingeri]NWE69122.1 DUF3144 domain-containing protein [Pseudomonas gingeri]PNQ88665.1 DUF3144 domain-containing protein [Pseudomonas gingeri NCPPB 3146 = LMG 5327]